MGYEDTLSFEDFKLEWTADSLNIPVRAYWFKDDEHFNVEFAHPRKLAMSSITATGMTKVQAQKWLDENMPAKLMLETL